MSTINKLEKYIEILDEYLNSSVLKTPNMSHPTPHTKVPKSSKNGLGTHFLLKKSINYDNVTNNKLILMHTMCHLFKDTGAEGLNKNDIKVIHDEIVMKLKSHTRFDNLDD